jgi:hypothetical protein
MTNSPRSAKNLIAAWGAWASVSANGTKLPIRNVRYPTANGGLVMLAVRFSGAHGPRRAGYVQKAVHQQKLGRGRPLFLIRGSEPQAFKSVIRIIATTLPSLAACSIVPLLQVQTKSFFAVKGLPSCTSRSSPSVI